MSDRSARAGGFSAAVFARRFGVVSCEGRGALVGRVIDDPNRAVPEYMGSRLGNNNNRKKNIPNNRTDRPEQNEVGEPCNCLRPISITVRYLYNSVNTYNTS